MPKGWLLVLGVAVFQTAAQGDEILINLTNQVWRYDQSGVDPGEWYHPAFNDSAWAEGRGIFAYEDTRSLVLSNNVYAHTNTVLLAPLAAPDAPNHLVDYFRTHFTFSGNPAHAVLTLSNLVDDGYVAYLNGVPADVFNMDASRTRAAAAVPGEGTYIVRTLCPPEGTLRQGENVLAVAVYQNAGTSSDVVWGTVLHASPVVIPQIISPTNTVHIALPEGRSTNLTVWAGIVPCIEYQWFFESNAIPGATGSTYTVTNMDISQVGTYYATVTTRGGTSRSPDFVVSFVPHPDTPVWITSAVADPWDLSRVTITFSEDIIDTTNYPLIDPLYFYVENRYNPGANPIRITSVTYGPSNSVLILTLEQPRDPASRYQLLIVNHTIQDRFGNPLADPVSAYVRVPIVFQNSSIPGSGYGGTQDTEIHAATPDTVLGQAPDITADQEDPLECQGLLRFDYLFGGGPSQVPFGVVITKATLRMYTADQTSWNTPIRLLRMLVPWDEGSTWNSLANGIGQTNGVETGVTDALIDGFQDNAMDEIDVTAAVHAWANGAPNYGWAFLATSRDGWAFASSEHPQESLRPALMVHEWHDWPQCFIMQQPRSVTVPERQSFSLSVLVTGSDLYYQWYKDGVALPGAQSPTYSVNRAHPMDQGNYYVRIWNNWPMACTSAVATITVCCPPPPPQLVSAVGNLDQTTISLRFDSTLDVTSAQNVSNYLISGGLNIVSAAWSGLDVTLTTDTPRQFGRNYTLTVANLRDDAAAANLIYPNPTVITLTQEVRLLSFDTVWRYQNTGVDLGTAWRQPQYDDSTWPEGPGLLGFETQTPIILALSNQNAFIGTWLSRAGSSGENIITDYFRTRVNVPFETNGVTFAIRHVTDDGAVFYFNGAEAVRYNMPTGVVDFTTVAPIAPGEGVVRSITNLTGLSNGWNSVAVEVHQQSALSADVLFGAEVIARVPRFLYGPLSILRNADGSVTVSWGQSLAILQEAPHLEGPWTDIQDAVSPRQIQIGSGNRFYRLR